MVKKTALYNAHSTLKATIVEFGGYLMPLRYKATSIIDEHLQVRENIGMFDTSHMGRFVITGKDVLEYLNILVPRDINHLKDMQSGYTFILNENGGFKDDVIITRFSSNEYLLVCNSSNFDKIHTWLLTIQMIWEKAGKEVQIEDKTQTSAMIAVQGPKAISLIEKLSSTQLPDKRFRVKRINIDGKDILYSTTGYTGSSGCELIIWGKNNSLEHDSLKIWKILFENGAMPCALGSRDTLRLEAGYRLYGNDLTESINLLESGLNFPPFVHMNKPDFIGKFAITQFKPERSFIGFKLLKKAIPRHGYPVFYDGENIGTVLSGTQSPLTKESFGMALIDKTNLTVNDSIEIEIRGKKKDAKIIKFPIFDKNKYGISIRH